MGKRRELLKSKSDYNSFTSSAWSAEFEFGFVECGFLSYEVGCYLLLDSTSEGFGFMDKLPNRVWVCDEWLIATN